MCEQGLKTGTKWRFTEPFPSFAPNTRKLYILRHCINTCIVFILPKNPLTLIYNCPLISPFDIFCQQQVNLISQSSTGNMWQGYQQTLYFSQWQYTTNNVSSQSNLTAQVHVVLFIFIGVISDVSTYTETVSFCCSTWIRYQQCFSMSMTK